MVNETPVNYIILEYCNYDLGTLIARYIDMCKAIPETTVKQISRNILNGIDFMHKKGFIHRDIKPSYFF
jgi:serine/threonine protein kinase